jgi:hypothetical protein
MPEPMLYKERTNLRTMVLALVVLGAGSLLLFISHQLSAHANWQALARDFGSLFVTIGCVTFLWELAAKRALVDELLATTNLTESIRSTGVMALAVHWYNDIPWGRLFADAEHVDLFVAYGVSWRGILGGELEKFAARSGTSCRIILPDPDNAEVMKAVATQFGRTEQSIHTRVTEGAVDFVTMLSRPGSQAKHEVWYSSKPPMFSFFIIGNSAVITLYKHNSAQTNVVGLVVRREGAFYKYLEKELSALVEGPSPLARRVTIPPHIQ